MKEKLFFVRIAWMNFYEGVDNDIPRGAGSYVTENKNGGEVYNFKQIAGKLYGYSRMQNGRSYNLTRVGADESDTVLEDFTIVFFATNPLYGKQYVVGWYRNAKLFKYIQELAQKGTGIEKSYNFVCKARDGKLIPTLNRTFLLPEGPGQSNVWYPDASNPAHRSFLKELKKYIHEPERRPRPGRGPYQPDIEKKKKVEMSAMDTTWNYYVDMGFEVEDVSSLNRGWDIEVRNNNKKFLIEVKGLSGPLNMIELSPNEYGNSQIRKNFLISVVYNALDDNKSIEIFKYNIHDQLWTSHRTILKVTEKIAAVLAVDQRL